MITIEIYSGDKLPRNLVNDDKFGSHPLLKAKYARSIINSLRNECKSSDEDVVKKFYSDSYDFIELLYCYSYAKLVGLKFEIKFFYNGESCLFDLIQEKLRFSVSRYIDNCVEQAIESNKSEE